MRDEPAASEDDDDGPESVGAGNGNEAYDADGVVKGDERDAGREHTDRPASKGPEPKTVTVSYAETKVSAPMLVNGSNVKPAKKLSDGPHGTIHTLNGCQIKIEIRIGDDGQIYVDQTIVRPR
jgi:hypothetical protein